MKKFLTILLTILICFSLAACQEDEKTAEQPVNQEETAQETIVEEDTKQEEIAIVEEIKEETINEETTVEETKEESQGTDVTAFSYWVNFLNYDGSVLQRSLYKYGSTPTYNGATPTYSDGAYTYTFSGWDKKCTPVTMTQTYKATYSKVAIPQNNPAPAIVNPVAKTNLVYTGEYQDLITAGTGATFTYSLDGGTYSKTTPTATDAGSYEVRYKKNGTDAGVILVTIEKRDITIETASDEKAYDGTPLAASEAADTWISAGSLADGDTYDVTMDASITNVGSVTNELADVIFFNEDQDDISYNYNLTKVEGTLTVTTAKVDVPTAAKNLKYDGTEQTGVATGTAYDLTGIAKATNAGVYACTATLKDKTNYVWNTTTPTTDDQTINWSIAKATLAKDDLTFTAPTNLVYDKSSKSASFTNSKTHFGSITVKYATSITAEPDEWSTEPPKNAGTYYVKAFIDEDTNHNAVNFTDSSWTFTITKAKVAVPTAKTDLVYNGTSQTGVTLPQDAKYTLSGNTATDAGLYQATASLTDTANYEWNLTTPTTSDQTINWSIAKATASLNLSAASGSCTIGTNGSFTYTYIGDGMISVASSDTDVAIATVDTSSKTVTVTPVAVGSVTITVSASAGNNYKETNATYAVTVNAAKFLTFTAEQAGSTIKFSWLSGSDVMFKPSSTNVKYDGTNVSSIDWTNYTANTVITLQSIDDYVMFKGTGCTTNAKNCFSMTGKIAASGDVTSLTNNVGGNATLSESCYNSMFRDCKSLTTAPALPAETLAKSCYIYMFRGCESLTSAPNLLSTTLADNCYESMFYSCKSLTKAPALPAETLAKSCYYSMFNECKSLTTAPALPAKTLASCCYYSMFKYCESLTTAPALPAETLAESCYSYMFEYCSNLTTAPSLPATTLALNCYNNMFKDCTSLYVSDSPVSGTAVQAWTIPGSGTFTNTTAYNQANMFAGCLGTRTSNSMAGAQGGSHTYYTQNQPVSVSSN